jgi:putative membrane protein
MEWVKVLHLLAVLGWMTGIFVAPRGLIFWKREYAATGPSGPRAT